jgi:hypothetical protein
MSSHLLAFGKDIAAGGIAGGYGEYLGKQQFVVSEL